MADSGTLGSMLQGVSQQPPHIRGDGQVTEQVNIISDVTEGLISRPGTTFLQAHTEPHPDANWQTVTREGKDYQLGTHSTGFWLINNKQGNLLGIAYDDAEVINYLSDEPMATYTYDDTLYLVNRDLKVGMISDTSAAEAEVTQNSLLVQSLGGTWSRTYAIVIQDPTGGSFTEYRAEYVTPHNDGNNASAYLETEDKYIMEQLYLAFVGAGTQAAPANLPAGAVLNWVDNVIQIDGLPSGYTATFEDGEDGNTFRFVIDGRAEVTTDLAKTAVDGTLVVIEGQSTSDDDVWFKFEADNASADPLTSQGRWVEWFNPAQTREFDLTTMPHKITFSGGVATLTKVDWVSRRVGNNDTNPKPSFVGDRIRDISGFQSRLVFATTTSVVMSRTDIATDFWIKTTTDQLASDPIDMLSTAEREYSLEYMLPFDRDLVVFGTRSQFLIQGGSALTPSNAALVATTEFEMSGGVKPVTTGTTILFPFLSGGYSGIKEFIASPDVEGNAAIDITKVQDRYIPGKVIDMVCTTNFSTAYILTDDPDTKRDVYCHQYYFDDSGKAQAAWYIFRFSHDVRGISVDDSRMSVLLYDDTLGYIMTDADLELPDEIGAGYQVSLDLKSYDAVSATAENTEFTEVTRNISGLVFVQGEGCAVPGETINATETDNGDGTYTYRLSKYSAPVGSSVYSGLRFARVLQPTMPFIRDGNGRVISKDKLTITDFSIYFERSGYFDAVMTSPYRVDPIVMTNQKIALANDPDDDLGNGLRSGEFKFPWGERSDRSNLIITSTDARPFNITEIEWFGQAQTRGRRR